MLEVSGQPQCAALVERAGFTLEEALLAGLARAPSPATSRGLQPLDPQKVRAELVHGVAALLQAWPALHVHLRACLASTIDPALRVVCWEALLKAPAAAVSAEFGRPVVAPSLPFSLPAPLLPSSF